MAADMVASPAGRWMMMGLSVLAVVLGVAASSATQSPASQSAGPAAALVKILDQQNMTVIAAADPRDASRFAAALYLPRSMLLVISARHPAPQLLQARILAGQHREVYADLQSAGEQAGRFFIEDLQVNGARPTRTGDEPFDLTWRDGVKHAQYDGRWEQQGLSAHEYYTRFERDDREYAGILALLAAAAGATN